MCLVLAAVADCALAVIVVAVVACSYVASCGHCFSLMTLFGFSRLATLGSLT